MNYVSDALILIFGVAAGLWIVRGHRFDSHVHLLESSERQALACGLSKYAVRSFHEGRCGYLHAVTCRRCLDAGR